jgi:hypothetical protein
MAIKCSVSQPFWGPIMPRACVRITGRACALQWFHAVFRRKFYRLDSHKISSPTLLSLLVMCVSCSLSLSIRVRTTLRYATSKTPISTLTRQTKSSPSLLVPAKRSAPHRRCHSPSAHRQYIFALPIFTLHDIYRLSYNYSIKSTPKVVGLR